MGAHVGTEHVDDHRDETAAGGAVLGRVWCRAGTAVAPCRPRGDETPGTTERNDDVAVPVDDTDGLGAAHRDPQACHGHSAPHQPAGWRPRTGGGASRRAVRNARRAGGLDLPVHRAAARMRTPPPHRAPVACRDTVCVFVCVCRWYLPPTPPVIQLTNPPCVRPGLHERIERGGYSTLELGGGGRGRGGGGAPGRRRWRRRGGPTGPHAPTRRAQTCTPVPWGGGCDIRLSPPGRRCPATARAVRSSPSACPVADERFGGPGVG